VATDQALRARLWAFMSPYRGLFGVGLALLPVISGLSLLQPYLVQVAIDRYISPGKLEGMGWVAAAFAGALVGAAALQFAQGYAMQVAGQRALRDLRQALFDRLMGLRLSFFHKTPVGRLMTRLTSDVESLQDALSSGLVTIVGDVLLLVAIVVILLVKSVTLSVVTFAVVPVVVGVSILFRALMRKAFREVRGAIAKLNSFLQERLSGMRVVQLMVKGEREVREFEAINREHHQASMASMRYDAIFFAIVELVGSITTALLIWYGAGEVVQDAMTLGMLVSFVDYVEKFFAPLRDLSQKYAVLQGAMASSERLVELLDAPEVEEEAADAQPLTAFTGSIEFKGVWFAYQAEDWVLKDVSFTIRRGERVALVGHTGAGKSTIAQLLLRFYDPQRGQILLDGQDIKGIRRADLRALFAMVLQDVFLYRGAILDNITLGDARVTAAQAQAAAASTQATRFIDRLPQGFAHVLQERGADLSAGERQLISFARALARKPQVVILDEATASVDTDTEHLIQEAIGALLDGQTSVVIAHRLSTIRRCDQIFVMHRGELRERGDHVSLMAEKGLYWQLYQLQAAEQGAANDGASHAAAPPPFALPSTS
jgi:ATP-binding cassette, subfamily B, multidrug efflux pump